MDPIQHMLRALADRRGFPIADGYCQRVSDEIYYLTGGHPNCIKSILLAIAEQGFVLPLGQWEEQWRSLFETYVRPTFQSEILDLIPDSVGFPLLD